MQVLSKEDLDLSGAGRGVDVWILQFSHNSGTIDLSQLLSTACKDPKLLFLTQCSLKTVGVGGQN